MQRVRVRVVDYNIMCFSFSAWVRLCSRLDECAIVHSEFALHIYMYPERKVLHFLSRLFVCLFVFSSLLLQTKCLIIVCTRNKNYYFLLILFVYCCCCFSFILGCCFWWRKRGEKKKYLDLCLSLCICENLLFLLFLFNCRLYYSWKTKYEKMMKFLGSLLSVSSSLLFSLNICLWSILMNKRKHV